MARAMRWPVTTVLCVSVAGEKQPPQARASAEGSAAAPSTTREATRGRERRFMKPVLSVEESLGQDSPGQRRSTTQGTGIERPQGRKGRKGQQKSSASLRP